jgi:hypothetical protein
MATWSLPAVNARQLLYMHLSYVVTENPMPSLQSIDMVGGLEMCYMACIIKEYTQKV